MRPLRIEFQAFGPYEGKETVDFEELASHGVFLICGKTGSGKTMLLDAMTFALYGDSSGHGSGRERFENMRCTSADPETPTFVRFEFENQGSVYRFERECAKKRTRFAVSCHAARKIGDEDWEELFENSKEKDLTAMAERLIGLTYDQFRQVIVLPQGQFEKLLTSKSEDKEKILTKIFRTEKWEKIAENFYREAVERKASLDEVKKEIDILLSEEGCQSVDELADRIREAEKELEEFESTFEKSENARKISALQEVLDLYGRLRREEEALRKKQAERDRRDRQEERFQRANEAESLRAPLTEWKKARDDEAAKQKEREALDAEYECAEKEADEAQKELKDHRSRESQVAEIEKRKLELTSKRKDYEQIATVAEELNEKKCVVNKAEKNEETSRRNVEDAEEKVVVLDEEYRRSGARYNELLDRYASGQIHEIRRQLKVGEPCPICGVIVDKEHYRMASEESTELNGSERVTREILDKEKESLDEKDTLLKEAVEQRNQLRTLHLEALDELAEHRKEMATVEGRYKSMESGLIEGIGSLAELDDEISSCVEKVDTYQALRQKLEEKEKEARENCVKVKTQREDTEKALHICADKMRDAEAAWKKALGGSIFSDQVKAEEALLDQETRLQLQKDVTAYDTEVKSLEERCREIRDELTEKGAPEGEAAGMSGVAGNPPAAATSRAFEQSAREQLERLEEERDTYVKESHERRNIIDSLKQKDERIREKSEGMEEACARAEEELAFAKQLRGDTGIGLHRYVLGIMLSEIVGAANRMLEKVHGGRYRLYRADDRIHGSYKKGLDLKVHDSHSEEADGRFVGTLSGGEKFLASLSLAIGMSTVAQKKGIKIEALFIDEGFGSLDEDSIEDAMDILKGLQRSSGMVGIISHVKLMQDSISTKVIVKTGENGSHIHTSIG